LSEATGASSAAPTYFDPKSSVNGYGLTELQIDGGIICNNPALYAYNIARHLRDKPKIRLLSLGTGEKEFAGYDSADDLNTVEYVKKMGEFMMNMDTYTAHWSLQSLYTDILNRPKDYLRM